MNDILGLELDEWWDLIKIVIGVMFATIVLMFGGMMIHEGAHLFVAACLGCEVVSFQFTGLLGGGSAGLLGVEIYMYSGFYRAPIAFAGAFAEGWYILAIRRSTKSQGIWIATLACWVYAVAEISMFAPLLTTMRILTIAVLYFGFALPRFKQIFGLSDCQRASVDLSVWVPSDRRRNR